MHNNRSNKLIRNRNPNIILQTIAFKESFITSQEYINKIDFQDFPGPTLIFQDFPVLENGRIKFQDFPRFPGTVRTLDIAKRNVSK